MAWHMQLGGGKAAARVAGDVASQCNSCPVHRLELRLAHLQHQPGAVADQVRQVAVHRQRGAQPAPLLVMEHAVRIQAHLAGGRAARRQVSGATGRVSALGVCRHQATAVSCKPTRPKHLHQVHSSSVQAVDTLINATPPHTCSRL